MIAKVTACLTLQDALRIIGRRLDAEPSYQFSLRQTEDGFGVQFYPSRTLADIQRVDFSWKSLEDLLVYHAAGRGLARRHHRYRGIWGNFPNGHEDFFRALGYDLDRSGAHDIHIQEGADGVCLSYRSPGGVRPVIRELGKKEIQLMLEDAQSRRRRTS